MTDSLLDPHGYSGRYRLIGGRLSLDFVNTISWPHSERRHDWLGTSENIAAWFKVVGLPSCPFTDSDLAAVHEYRDILSLTLRPLAHGDRPAPAMVERFNGLLATALTRRFVDAISLTWAWKRPESGGDALAPVVLDAADVMTSTTYERLKYCDACDWLFEDQTRNGRRRWCDMAVCGSRAKSRAYYHRMKAE